MFHTRPEGLDENAPVVIVMHGMSRTAREYHEDWKSLALQHGFILIVPEFTSDDFPGSRTYNLGNTFDEHGQPVERDRWTYSAIEPLFDSVRDRFGLNTATYSIYGHSAGAQFVHRFLMHIPEARVSRAVAANAGWYTLPDFSVDWPYGLNGSQVSHMGLSRALGMELMVLLGDQDIAVRDESLRSTPEAMRQGPHRLARGFHFFEAGLRAAKRTGLESSWSLARVEGADHDNAKMAPAAAFHLMSD